MVKYDLQISAQGENILELYPDSDPELRWYMKIKCTNCGEIQGKADHWIYLDQEEYSTQNGQKANFVNKCKGCKREMTVSIVQNSLGKYIFDDEKGSTFQTVVQFEARGVELMEYDFRAGWNAKALNSNHVFKGLEFSSPDYDWADYDSKAKEPVSLFELKSQFIKAH